MKTFVVDTGPLVAYLRESDQYHEWARQQFQQYRFPFLTCEPVLTETALGAAFPADTGTHAVSFHPRFSFTQPAKGDVQRVRTYILTPAWSELCSKASCLAQPLAQAELWHQWPKTRFRHNIWFFRVKLAQVGW